MAYRNCGATVGGFRPKSKKALREALATTPHLVRFDGTALGDGFSLAAKDLPEADFFSVVGPDPYTKRMWYATVQRKGEKVTLK